MLRESFQKLRKFSVFGELAELKSGKGMFVGRRRKKGQIRIRREEEI